MSLIYCWELHGTLKSIMSTSLEGSDKPMEFEPKSMASVDGKRFLMKYLTLSKQITLLS